MPSKSDKQRKFFGAVMGAKKGKPGSSGKAKEVAKDMSEESIKHYLHKESYDQGFTSKCAEYNVDPAKLIKHAQTNAPIALAPPGKPKGVNKATSILDRFGAAATKALGTPSPAMAAGANIASAFKNKGY